MTQRQLMLKKCSRKSTGIIHISYQDSISHMAYVIISRFTNELQFKKFGNVIAKSNNN